jgi:uncharacterized membrane protein (UPF0127 family)
LLTLGAAWATMLVLGMLGVPAVSAIESIDHFPSTPLSIRTHDGAEWFTVWIADTPEREQQGLMYQRWLPTDHGMLFPQAEPRVMSMWMKNTLIPLDMVFIDAQGRIVYIRENATPQSEAIISAPMPVRAVLELAGGLTGLRGIRVGDRVLHPLFGTAPMGPVRH